MTTQCAGIKGCEYVGEDSEFESDNPRRSMKCPKCGKTDLFKWWSKGKPEPKPNW